MAPISYGRMYPSARLGVNQVFVLKILHLGQDVAAFIHQLNVLHHYLSDIGRDDVGVKVYTTIDNEQTQRSVAAQVVQLALRDKQSVEAYARQHNIDVVHDPGNIFVKRNRFTLKHQFAFTTVSEELIRQVESYLTGNAIPWLLREPVWHINWLYKYTHEQTLAQRSFDFIATGQQKQYDPKQMEFVRALANKAMHVEHAREQLYFFMQLKRRAARTENTINDFSFELTYHLTTYSFFICSTMDITARLINSLYSLGYTRFQAYGIEKTDFISRLAAKRKTLANVYSRKRFQFWADWMKVRRNHLAHESNVYLTPLMRRRPNPLPDADLEKMVDAAFDWDEYAAAGIDASGTRAIVKQQLDLEHNYIEVVSDMMTLEKVDRTTRQSKAYIVFPLRTIDDDFTKLNDVISRTIENLSVARPQRNTTNP